MSKYELSDAAVERLGYYVYLLIDPRDDKVFYVGKGKGWRILAHLGEGSDVGDDAPEKDKRIRDIRAAGCEIKPDVLRQGLTEEEAFEIEAAVIDLIGIGNLTNRMRGHRSDRGRMPLKDIAIMHGAEDAVFDEPAILLRITQRYEEDMSDEKMYRATKDAWSVSLDKVKDIKLACSVYRGIIREVFAVDEWSYYPSTSRRRKVQFEGEIDLKKRDKYIGKSVARRWKRSDINSHKIVGPDPD